MIEFSIPLCTYVNAKRFGLNLNEYRNAHYRVLSSAKKSISAIVFVALLKEKKIAAPVKVTITLWRKNKKKCDLSNICSIADKFALDAIVRCKIIDDDDCLTIPLVEYIYGGIDKENPRIDIKLESII